MRVRISTAIRVARETGAQPGRKTIGIVAYIKRHPLGTVMGVAILLRLVAVLFSKGYMASDDHYDTIEVAYNWLSQGFYTDQGHLIWAHRLDGIIARFPLYTFSLHAIMRVYYWCGVEALDTMMYGIRAVHAAVSLILVYAVYRTVELVTRSNRWALAAGLIMAAHGVIPFLSVRALIEMVGGELLMLAVYWLYRYQEKGEERWLFWAGVMTGLAWMIRLQIAAAALPIPFLLWWQAKNLKTPLKYLAGGLIVFLLEGVIDYLVVGRWFGITFGSFNSWPQPMYNTIFLIYPAVLLVFYIPPFSILATVVCFNREVWRRHKLLILMIVSFVAVHMLFTNRQERFMIPLIGPLGTLFVLALWQHFQEGGWLTRHRLVWRTVIGISIVINLILLPVFTVNYSHKGLVEPFVRIQRLDPRPRVVMVSPDRHQLYAQHYAGIPLIDQVRINSWQDLDRYLPDASEEDYYLFYPQSEDKLSEYLSHVESRSGPLELVFTVGVSSIDWLLHIVNPSHNPLRRCWVYRRATGTSTGCGSSPVISNEAKGQYK